MWDFPSDCGMIDIYAGSVSQRDNPYRAGTNEKQYPEMYQVNKNVHVCSRAK